MGRAPCCDKMGVKKGPWTAEEDRILTDFILRNGHGNWRALPKQAGLLRCGKSCRLRWINYLRPDIKRGNFSHEEETAIIKLHKLLGNRWSAIASRLPGRTDNEIKNMWNTHLKKRLLRTGTDQVTSAVATMAGNSQISLDYSECSGASPSMKKDMLTHNSVLTHPKVSVDYPTTILSYSDDLSSEIFSSTDNETVNSDPTLDCIQFDCKDSFDVELEYQKYPTTKEDHSKHQNLVLDDTFIMGNQSFGDEQNRLQRQSSEEHCFMSAYGAENDMLNSMDAANTYPMFWNGEFQAYEDDCDSMGYWLSILTQAGPSPTLYDVASLSQS